MHIREIREGDIEAVIQLFRKSYGDDHAIPEFYDPQWVKRGIYSDHIIWLVMEDQGRIVASGACILNFGDYNDPIGEIARLVVDPELGGRGLGRSMLSALVDASDEQVEFAFAEARTVHPKTQKIDDRMEIEFWQDVCAESTPAAGEPLAPDALYVILSGSVAADGRNYGPGECVGTAAVLGNARRPARGGRGSAGVVIEAGGAGAAERAAPRLAIKLYRNLVAQRDD